MVFKWTRKIETERKKNGGEDIEPVARDKEGGGGVERGVGGRTYGYTRKM